MPPHLRRTVYSIWREAFRELEHHGIPHRFGPRQLAGLYAVASICYYGNETSFIPDSVYDRLCDWLLKNVVECRTIGADQLDAGLLRCHSGYKLKQFVKPYHDISAVLMGHPCRCIECRRLAEIAASGPPRQTVRREAFLFTRHQESQTAACAADDLDTAYTGHRIDSNVAHKTILRSC